MRPHWIEAAAILATAGTLGLTGCGMSVTAVHEQPPTTAVQGHVIGGAQPVANATLQLYAVSSGGYGTAATALFSPAITTSATGGFTFPSSYCPANASTLVYLVGTGGQPAGAGAGITNNNLALMAALGPCNSLNSSTHIEVNELTTVAAVWALAPFMSGNTTSYTNVGTSSTNATGLQLAFAAVNEVVNPSTGQLPGTLPGGATLPTNEINTLADILSYCINSGGGTANDSSNCGKLFGYAPNTAGSTYPTDTITAAMNIAQNPARNVPQLNALTPTTPPFQPTLGATAPAAWTVAINYTGGGLNAPTAIATDQSGNVWVANSGGSSVSQLTNSGAPNSAFGASGVALGGEPAGIAIDLTGNGWATTSANNVVEVTSGGSVGSTLTGNGLSTPTSIAIDGGGLLWVVNSASGANSVSAFTSSGGVVTGSPFTGSGIASPAGIAINGQANAN